MFLIHDPGIIGDVSLFSGRIAYISPVNQPFLEMILQTFGDKNIIRCHTRLSGIYEFSKNDSFGSQVHIGAFIYDHGTFTAQFQAYRRQICRGSLHHFFPDRGAPREKNVIEWQGKQPGILGPPPLYNRAMFLSEAFPNDLCDYRRSGRGIGRRFHDGTIARRQCAHQGVQRQEERVIPGRHDQDNSVRFTDSVTPCRQKCQGSPGRDVPGPFVQSL